MLYIGHKSENGREQLLIDHLNNVALLSQRFSSAFDEAQMGYYAGLYHDLGKYSKEFQNRINLNGPKVDHSTAGAKELLKAKNPEIAFCVAGHHSGLQDMGSPKISVPNDGTFCGRLKKEIPDYSGYDKELISPTVCNIKDNNKHSNQFSDAFFTRMIFSCLVDADFLDTEQFMSDGEIERSGFNSIAELRQSFESYCKQFSNATTPINQKRSEIFNQCLAKASSMPGVFSLTVPTGGGKTISSMAFALKHALEYGKKRIIYVIPYTSIIEQTADIFRIIFGAGNVIEHHMNVDYGSVEDRVNVRYEKMKLATENWDAPIIVTTNVQFLESLFANKVSKCRKIHNIVDSVVIFDEAQMLPNDYMLPTVKAIAELVKNYKTTVVLCTATQPSLDKFFELKDNALKVQEICEDVDGLYKFFRRVKYEEIYPTDIDDLVHRVNDNLQVLCITNSKKDAQYMYSELSGEGCYHLSTFMYPHHRREVLEIVRQRLKDGLPCKVVSTSLIEAGVDVDFPIVFREIAGLDSCIQAAGRCNREGKRDADSSKVYIYDLNKEIKKIPSFIRLPMGITRELISRCSDLAGIETVKEYFDQLHYWKADSLDKKDILNECKKFNFRQVALKYKLIEEETTPVFINFCEESAKLLTLLKSGMRNRGLMRKIAQYTVAVYNQQLSALLSNDALEALDDQLYLLKDNRFYDRSMGLIITDSEGISNYV